MKKGLFFQRFCDIVSLFDYKERRGAADVSYSSYFDSYIYPAGRGYIHRDSDAVGQVQRSWERYRRHGRQLLEQEQRPFHGGSTGTFYQIWGNYFYAYHPYFECSPGAHGIIENEGRNQHPCTSL